MVDISLDPPRRAFAILSPFLVPAARHAGWFAVFLMLATVIGPHGYGLFTMALSAVAIVEALLVESATAALVRRVAIEPRHWSTALVTMIVAGGALWLVFYALIGALGAAFGEPSLRELSQPLAILPLLGGLGVVPRASLRREGRETPLLAASAAGFAAGAGIGLSLAWSGAGPWSLVAQIVVQRLVECVVLWGIPGDSVGIAWSRRHFVELARAADWRAVGTAAPAILLYGSCLAVGLALGPTATGLYMLAMWPAMAIAEIGAANWSPTAPGEALRRLGQVALPAVLAGTLLATALPPLVDLRWWSAVLPGQILALGAIPAALAGLRALGDGRWSLARALIGIAIVAVFAGQGLAAVAEASLAWAILEALAALTAIRFQRGAEWRATWQGAPRPGAGAALAGALLLFLSAPVSLALATVPALCLLTAGGWLVYLVVRGDPAEPAAPAVAFAPAAAIARLERGG